MNFIENLKRALKGIRGVANNAHQTMLMGVELIRSTLFGQEFGIKNVYTLECFDSKGNLKWTGVVENLVVNVGLDEVLDKFWKGSTYTAAHFVGLTDGTPTIAAADTMASHVGWTEVTAYSEATREALTMGTVASQSVDNSASKASYSINGTATVGGAFVTTVNTKGGTTGVLVGAGAFTGGDKSVGSGDTLNVTVTSSATSS